MRRQQQQQRFPSHPAAPTHVCRVLTESADMALGATAPDFEVNQTQLNTFWPFSGGWGGGEGGGDER
jgi:hypothetical protein